jgi:hypothetical protein
MSHQPPRQVNVAVTSAYLHIVVDETEAVGDLFNYKRQSFSNSGHV